MDHDLIVVGGGPVGVSLALALRGLGVALVVPERRAPQLPSPGSFDVRVYALSPANVAFLRQLAVLPEERLTPVHAMRVYGDGDSRIDFDAYRAGVPALAWIIEDAVLQAALWKDVSVVAGRCESLTVEDSRVLLRLADRELAGRLIVGADGAQSFVRQHAGIAVKEKAYGQEAVVANFACERSHANTAYQWFQGGFHGGFQGGAVLALLPLPGNHVSMVWSLPEAQAAGIAGLEPQALCAQVEAATRSLLGQLEVVTPPRTYPLRRLSARRLVAPRIALVGDAAHVIHPLAGQGLNLGLQDVRTLSRVVLARETVRDAGDFHLLRRYERARAEPILAMDTMVDGLYRLFGAQGAAAARIRNAGLNLTDRVPVLKNILIHHAMG